MAYNTVISTGMHSLKTDVVNCIWPNMQPTIRPNQLPFTWFYELFFWCVRKLILRPVPSGFLRRQSFLCRIESTQQSVQPAVRTRGLACEFPLQISGKWIYDWAFIPAITQVIVMNSYLSCALSLASVFPICSSDGPALRPWTGDDPILADLSIYGPIYYRLIQHIHWCIIAWVTEEMYQYETRI